MSHLLVCLVQMLVVAHALVLLCHPAILFGLRYWLSVRIPVVAVCILSILMGWSLLVAPMLIAPMLPEGTASGWAQEGPGAVAALMVGWIVSGFLLLLWSPLFLLFPILRQRLESRRLRTHSNHGPV